MGIADDMKNLAQDIADSYHVRIRDIAALKKETAALLKDFDAAHAEMSAQLKGALAKGEAQRLEDFKAMNAEIKNTVAGIEKHTAKLLKDFDTVHAEMSAQLKGALAKGETQRLDDFKAMNAEIKKDTKERMAEISKMLKEFQTERERMSVEWQKLEEMLLRERSKEVSPKKKKAIEREELAEHVKMVASPSAQ